MIIYIFISESFEKVRARLTEATFNTDINSTQDEYDSDAGADAGGKRTFKRINR